MAIIPWRRSNQRSLAEREGDPFSYLRQQINRVFDDFWGEPWPAPGETLSGFAPQVDVTETDKELKVCAEIPGVEAKDIDVSVEDGTLRIRGEKKYEREGNEKGQYRMERSYGSFERAIPLPVEVDEAKAKAEFQKRRFAIDTAETPRSPVSTEENSNKIIGLFFQSDVLVEV
jgi:HSP20 family protein